VETPTSTIPTTSTTINPDAALEEQCGELESDFTATGTVGTGGSEASDATVIEAFSWESVGACERIRIGFATPEGAPAVEPPLVGVRFLRWAGVVRLEFGSGVTDAVIAEQVVDTSLVDRIYTVMQVDGTMFVDIHLREPVFARAFTSSRPAALAVDLAPGGLAYTHPVRRVGELVLVPPDPAAATYPLTITGYALGATDSVEGLLRASDGSTVVGEAAVGPSDFTWGAFSMVFPDGPRAQVTITVGDQADLDLTIR
jgi:hypothetical protein